MQQACDGVSPSVLNARMSELRELGFVTSQDSGYELSAQAHALSELLLLPLDAWANRWAKAQAKR